MEGGSHPLFVKDVYLNPGQFCFGTSNYRIRTLLGSCIALILWHPEKKLGGMSHIILPSRKIYSDSSVELPGKYADESLALFEKSAKLYRTSIQEYKAKIFGGSHLISTKPEDIYVSAEEKKILESTSGRFNIGEKNSRYIKDLLATIGIPIVGEHIGGNKHRKVYFTVWDGEVWMENQKD